VEGRISARRGRGGEIIARVLYTRYCALELSTRIFA
jgi:hypothetical protein